VTGESFESAGGFAQMTTHHEVADALAEWRAAEARLRETDPGSSQWLAGCAEVERAKARYHEALAAVASTAESVVPLESARRS
jgi:hypothetical protein